MTPESRRLLEASWPATDEAAEALARHFYARLFEIDPSAAALFAATDMTAQRRKLTDMLRWMVHALDMPDELVPGTAALARRHVQYGATDHHYDSVGDALRDALAETLGERFTPDVRAAWVEGYALLASVMKRTAHLHTSV
jgi:hemoglobin-like flavoprotein